MSRFQDLFTPFMSGTAVCLTAFLTLSLWPSAPGAGQPFAAPAGLAVQADTEPLRPVETPPLDARKVALGGRLFHDPRLSKDDTVSCASCHDLNTGGADRRARSRGVGGREGDRNAPTVFNSGLNYRQFWDGRAATLEEQVGGPLRAQAEMASDWPEVIRKLRADADYAAAFRALYREGIQPHSVSDAIAAFERSLVTPDSRFDRFLTGSKGALSAREVRGFRLFKSYGCASCHQGANVGGNLMQPFGVMADPSPLLRGGARSFRLQDEVGARPGALFKVPGLRNVARTAPYFHDGSTENLEDAVRIMSLAQLGRRLGDTDVACIASFLRALTGRYEGRDL